MGKTLILFVLLAVNFTANAQLNELDIEEISNVKINNVKLGDISKTNGNTTSIKNLFTETINVRTYDLPSKGKEFWNDSFLIRMEDDMNEGSYSITYIKIKSEFTTVILDGVEFKIGDDKSKFDNYFYNRNSRSYAFVDSLTNSFMFKFKINSSDKISSIEIMSF